MTKYYILGDLYEAIEFTKVTKSIDLIQVFKNSLLHNSIIYYIETEKTYYEVETLLQSYNNNRIKISLLEFLSDTFEKGIEIFDSHKLYTYTNIDIQNLLKLNLLNKKTFDSLVKDKALSIIFE